MHVRAEALMGHAQLRGQLSALALHAQAAERRQFWALPVTPLYQCRHSQGALKLRKTDSAHEQESEVMQLR